MKNHSAILEPYKGRLNRYTCPACGKRNEFSRYINSATGKHIADHVGRCNREGKCGHHYSPKQYYEDNKYSIDFQKPPDQFKPKSRPAEPVKPVEYLPFDLIEKSMTKYESNNFYVFLRSLFGEDVASRLANTYYLGTSKKWNGANVFYQVDVNAEVRQAKIMLYNPVTGRRVKDGGDRVFFAGKSLLNGKNANLQQCFFGEVLLTIRPNDTIAIVESEKTAMIASVYYPQLVWLATGGSHGCRWTNYDVCKVLKGRKVILFPDLGFFEKWLTKAEEVKKEADCKIVVSDLLEKNGTDEQRASGWDIADYLLLNRDSSGFAMTTEGYPLFWDLITEAL